MEFDDCTFLKSLPSNYSPTIDERFSNDEQRELDQVERVIHFLGGKYAGKRGTADWVCGYVRSKLECTLKLLNMCSLVQRRPQPEALRRT